MQNCGQALRNATLDSAGNSDRTFGDWWGYPGIGGAIKDIVEETRDANRRHIHWCKDIGISRRYVDGKSKQRCSFVYSGADLSPNEIYGRSFLL